MAAFRQLPDNVACVQAELRLLQRSLVNPLTRFTAEYALWFSRLPKRMMVSMSPIPLGRHSSNHLRRDILRRSVRDPFNVTEDADLGLRIASNGYRTAVIDHSRWRRPTAMHQLIRQRSRCGTRLPADLAGPHREPPGCIAISSACSFIRSTRAFRRHSPNIAVLNSLPGSSRCCGSRPAHGRRQRCSPCHSSLRSSRWSKLHGDVHEHGCPA